MAPELKSLETSQRGAREYEDGFGVPIALFNFNRPELTRRVFEVVREIRPRRLLLIADGPRRSNPDDAHMCAQVRSVFDDIDWECEVSRNFSDFNLGSFKRNSSGLNWVFNTVEEAIVLEDDCLPSPSFFRFCEELLERYRDDPRVGVISGDNFGFPKSYFSSDSYFFSAYALTWGWASWRRVWRQVDLSMSWWEPREGKKMLRTSFPNPLEWRYWYALYERIHSGKMNNAWDYQLILSSLRHSQYCVVPRVNLVSNVGFGDQATHCRDGSSPLQAFPVKEITFPLAHPADVRRSAIVDHAIFRIRIHPSFWQRVWSDLVRILKRVGKKIT